MRTCPKCHLEYHDDESRCVVDGSALDDVVDPRIGKLVGGRYHLDAVLGEGGMATVFRAHHTVINRIVAVKLLHPHIARDQRIRERFAREARSAAAIAHPNVIEIYDFGDTEEGIPYLVMELLEGDALRKLVERGPLPLDLAVDIAIQLLRGLARAHDLGVAHRDIKPENAFVQTRADGSVVAKLVDFGIAYSRGDARLTDIGDIIGTPQYVAPERLKGIESGAPADLYSFGVMLFEMVTGQLPFQADGLPGWIMMHLETAPPRPSQLRPEIPADLERLILELLAKEPKDRPVDARAALDALERLRPTLGPERSTHVGLPSTRASTSPPPGIAPPRMEDEWTRATPLPPRSELLDASSPVAASEYQPPAQPARTQSLTIERWQRRAAVIQQMLERAYPGGSAPAELRALVRDVEQSLGRMVALRDARVGDQRRLDEIASASRDSRERLGHAVHQLGELLSRARVDLRAAEELVESKRSEVSDLEFQIGALREKLAEAEASSFEQRESSDVSLAESGEELERLRRDIGQKTLAVLNAVKHFPAVRPLLVELERSQHD